LHRASRPRTMSLRLAARRPLGRVRAALGRPRWRISSAI
jgi:hypothetical protein